MKSIEAQGKVNLIIEKVASKAEVIKWVSHVHLWSKTIIVG